METNQLILPFDDIFLLFVPGTQRIMDILGTAFAEIIDVPLVQTYLQVTLYIYF